MKENYDEKKLGMGRADGLVLCLSVSWMTGCAKRRRCRKGPWLPKSKEGGCPWRRQKRRGNVGGGQQGCQRSRALRDQALSDQAARETAEAAREAAEKAAKEAADRAKGKPREKAAAILQELQIADINFDFDKYNLKPEAHLEILKKRRPGVSEIQELQTRDRRALATSRAPPNTTWRSVIESVRPKPNYLAVWASTRKESKPSATARRCRWIGAMTKRPGRRTDGPILSFSAGEVKIFGRVVAVSPALKRDSQELKCLFSPHR